MISSMASAIDSSGTSRPSLNRVGSSTSKRRNLFLIGRLSLHRKGDVLVRKSRQRALRDDEFSRFQGLAGEPPEEEPQRLFSRRIVRKRDDDHDQSSGKR